ncbi:hypothetical protein [Desulfoluna sp.]|uniref:hypothetical protein n=1 Tax=Desulfoluna sp. TaxID=2045199 RepID=UPI002619EC0E|nr:hypothetical protein [Desulfoluna sp.]
MGSAKENLRRYLEIETLLNRFFGLYDFCLKKCVLPELARNGNQPFAACCKDKYYKVYDLEHPSFDLLRDERVALYGPPEEVKDSSLVSPCEYHTSTGCVLPTHKSPICLAFMCRKSIDGLRNDYGIYTYDYLGFNYALEWILTGDLSLTDYEEFRQSCLDMIDTLEKKSSPKRVASAR